MLTELTTPATEPVTASEAAQAARLDADLYAADLPRWIATGRALAEQHTGRCLAARDWRVSLTDWPATTDRLHVPEPTAVAITYWTGSAWSAAMDAAAYAWADGDGCTLVAPATGTSWPTLGDRPVGDRVRITITSTPAIAPAPACVRDYICAVVRLLATLPEADAMEAARGSLSALLDPLRRWSV